jgi:hypothetical protein
MALPTTIFAFARTDVAPPTPAAITAKAAKNWRRCIFPSLLAVIFSFAGDVAYLQYVSDNADAVP